jgi:membrane protease YdiL (CAAX protease family)
MTSPLSVTQPASRGRPLWPGIAIGLGLAAFCIGFLLLDQAYYNFVAARFPNVGASAELATLWGLVSRAYLLLLMVPLVIWRPRLFGFQLGRTRQYWRLLLVMLIVNCGVVALFLLLTGSGTPYSGNQWLFTEIITVPVVEETFWRGIVFVVLLALLRRYYAESASLLLTVWLSGLAFGVLHAGNALAGVPLSFVAVQVLNATIWGVAYGYARAKTDSVYPPMFLHAAMNLVVILF